MGIRRITQVAVAGGGLMNSPGKELGPPDIAGMMTFTTQYRNFNVFWKDAEGQPVSVSYIGEYAFTKDGYCEKPIFWLQNNLGAPGLSYTAPAEKSKCTAVTGSGKIVTFQIRGEPPVVTFEGDKLTAEAEGLFVDHRERVK